MSDPSGDLDLTTRPGEGESAPGLSRLRERPYNPVDDREKKRGLIALSLVAILCASVVLSFLFVFIFGKEDIEAIKAILEIIFAPIVGLVGAVTGFYFGEKQAGK